MVILGIFITLTATNYFSGQSKKKEYRQIIEMVHSELVDNKDIIDRTVNQIELHQEKMRYFHSQKENLNSIPLDTLMKYRFIHFSVEFINLPSHSLEVLKYSSSIYANKDIRLLRDVISAYDNVDMCKKLIETYYEVKQADMDLVYQEVDWRGHDAVSIMILQYNTQAMSDYLSSSFASDIVRECRVLSLEIGGIINELEKKYKLEASVRN